MFGGDKAFFTKKEEKPMVEETKAETYAEKRARETREKGIKEMEKYVNADHQEMVDARAYKPVITIADYPTGKFFCVDDREWPLRYVESIEVGDVGHEPYWRYISCSVHAPREASRAAIMVTMHSGQSHRIECNRHQLDPLLDAMKTAWKSGRGRSVDSDE